MRKYLVFFLFFGEIYYLLIAAISDMMIYRDLS